MYRIKTHYPYCSIRSVLVDYRELGSANPQPLGPGPLPPLASDQDRLILEDESGRVSISGEDLQSLTSVLCTGVVVGLKGRIGPGGEFMVS
ncbi:hypothetical protein EON65_02650 [archaeon]|nr:MAG: hypothetical protein EON65_02650 [archaeon]